MPPSRTSRCDGHACPTSHRSASGLVLCAFNEKITSSLSSMRHILSRRRCANAAYCSTHLNQAATDTQTVGSATHRVLSLGSTPDTLSHVCRFVAVVVLVALVLVKSMLPSQAPLLPLITLLQGCRPWLLVARFCRPATRPPLLSCTACCSDTTTSSCVPIRRA